MKLALFAFICMILAVYISFHFRGNLTFDDHSPVVPTPTNTLQQDVREAKESADAASGMMVMRMFGF